MPSLSYDAVSLVLRLPLILAVHSTQLVKYFHFLHRFSLTFIVLCLIFKNLILILFFSFFLHAFEFSGLKELALVPCWQQVVALNPPLIAEIFDLVLEIQHRYPV
jgi:hypothetical protein